MADLNGDWYFSSSHAAKVTGGFSIPISNDYWDSPEEDDLDENLYLTSLVVPADPGYAEDLLDRIRKQDHPIDDQLLALLNYPGPASVKVFEKVIQSGSPSGLTASRLFYYLHYRRSPNDPLDKKLLGRWELLGANETVELELSKDHTCVVNTRPTNVTRLATLQVTNRSKARATGRSVMESYGSAGVTSNGMASGVRLVASSSSRKGCSISPKTPSS